MAYYTDAGLNVMVNYTKAYNGFSLVKRDNFYLMCSNSTKDPAFKATYNSEMM